MYTLEEIHQLFADCRNSEEFEFLCRWIRLLIDTGVQERNPEITVISLMRFSELYK